MKKILACNRDAAGTGRKNCVKRPRQGPAPDIIFDDISPLQSALSNGEEEIARELLRNGANPWLGASLHNSVQSCPPLFSELAYRLLADTRNSQLAEVAEARALMNVPNFFPILTVAPEADFETLIELGAKLTFVGSEYSPLHLLAQNGQLEKIKALIKAWRQVQIKNRKKQESIFQDLKNILDTRNHLGKTVSQTGVDYSQIDIVRYFAEVTGHLDIDHINLDSVLYSLKSIFIPLKNTLTPENQSQIIAILCKNSTFQLCSFLMTKKETLFEKPCPYCQETLTLKWVLDQLVSPNHSSAEGAACSISHESKFSLLVAHQHSSREDGAHYFEPMHLLDWFLADVTV